MDKGLIALLIPIMAIGIPLAAVIGGIFLKALKIWKGVPSEQSPQLQEEETKLIQELYQGLSKMEERVEALETILLDRQRKEGHR
jgi:phage shock protein B